MRLGDNEFFTNIFDKKSMISEEILMISDKIIKKIFVLIINKLVVMEIRFFLFIYFSEFLSVCQLLVLLCCG